MITSIWTQPGGDYSIAMEIRTKVFVDEQGVPAERERDALDSSAWHLAFLDEDKPIAAGRMVYIGDSAVKLGRIAVLPSYRGQGIGDGLIKAMLFKAETLGLKRAVLSSQLHAVGLYEKIGFIADGEQYLEEGIPHIHMEMELGHGTRCNCQNK